MPTATISPICHPIFCSNCGGFFGDDKWLAQKVVFIDQFQGHMVFRGIVQECIAFF
jgi:hypothetical protein